MSGSATCGGRRSSEVCARTGPAIGPMLAAHDSMRSSRCRRVIRRALVCAGAMALASCSGGSLTADGGTGGGGFMTCDHPPRITSCSPDAGTLPVVSTTPFPEVPTAISPCSVEGASCEGTYCYDWGDRPFKTTCCAGRWRSDFAGPCPGPFPPGDPFVCTADLSCTIGQTYCSSSNPDRTETRAQSCQPVCAAGDCSCFCDEAEGCDFRPPGSACPVDECHCRRVTAGPNIPVPGAVAVQCDYAPLDISVCYPDPNADARCGGLRYAVLCAGSDDLPADCTPLPESGETAACGFPVRYYCCNV